VEGFSNALLPTDPQTPQPGRPGRGLGWGCRDGGGVSSGEASQVKGRNRPRTSPAKFYLLAAGGCRERGSPKLSAQAEQGPGQSRSRFRLHGAGQRQSCLPITCLSGLQKKTFPVEQKIWDLFVCLMLNQLTLLGMFPLWEGSNSRIFLSPFPFLSLSLGGSGGEEGRGVAEV